MRIYQARDFCLKNNKGCEVVYGDSVPGDEPILIKYRKGERYETKYIEIQELIDNRFNYGSYKMNNNRFRNKY